MIMIKYDHAGWSWSYDDGDHDHDEDDVIHYGGGGNFDENAKSK